MLEWSYCVLLKYTVLRKFQGGNCNLLPVYHKESRIQKTITKAEKAELLLPLATSFLREGIVVICNGADESNLTRNYVTKVKPF